MNRTSIIFDDSPETKHLYAIWNAREASITGDTLKIEWNRGTLEIQAVDPELVADILFSHDSKAEIVTGKLGIQRVSYTKKETSQDLTEKFRRVLKEILYGQDEQ